MTNPRIDGDPKFKLGTMCMTCGQVFTKPGSYEYRYLDTPHDEAKVCIAFLREKVETLVAAMEHHKLL